MSPLLYVVIGASVSSISDFDVIEDTVGLTIVYIEVVPSSFLLLMSQTACNAASLFATRFSLFKCSPDPLALFKARLAAPRPFLQLGGLAALMMAGSQYC